MLSRNLYVTTVFLHAFFNHKVTKKSLNHVYETRLNKESSNVRNM